MDSSSPSPSGPAVDDSGATLPSPQSPPVLDGVENMVPSSGSEGHPVEDMNIRQEKAGVHAKSKPIRRRKRHGDDLTIDLNEDHWKVKGTQQIADSPYYTDVHRRPSAVLKEPYNEDDASGPKVTEQDPVDGNNNGNLKEAKVAKTKGSTIRAGHKKKFTSIAPHQHFGQSPEREQEHRQPGLEDEKDDGFMPSEENGFKFKYGNPVTGRSAQELDELLEPPLEGEAWPRNKYIEGLSYTYLGELPPANVRYV